MSSTLENPNEVLNLISSESRRNGLSSVYFFNSGYSDRVELEVLCNFEFVPLTAEFNLIELRVFKWNWLKFRKEEQDRVLVGGSLRLRSQCETLKYYTLNEHHALSALEVLHRAEAQCEQRDRELSEQKKMKALTVITDYLNKKETPTNDQ